MKVIFDHAREEAADISSFYFKPERPVHYTAGQFIELTLKHQHPDSRGIKHWFSLSSSPTEEMLSITTKFAGKDKTSSFKKALIKLQPDAELNMSDPMGDFVLPKLIQTPLIFVAGGMGITPYHSILSWLAETGETRPVKLIYGVRSEEEIIFQDTFVKAGIQPIIIVSEPSPAWGGERGRLSVELILGLGKPTDDSLIYISGPEAMVESLGRDLQEAGIKQHQLVLDSFPGYPPA